MTHNITERDDTLYTHEFVRCLTPHSIYALKKEGVKKDELIWKEKEQFAVKGELPEITELKYRDFLVGRQSESHIPLHFLVSFFPSFFFLLSDLSCNYDSCITTCS